MDGDKKEGFNKDMRMSNRLNMSNNISIEGKFSDIIH